MSSTPKHSRQSSLNFDSTSKLHSSIHSRAHSRTSGSSFVTPTKLGNTYSFDQTGLDLLSSGGGGSSGPITHATGFGGNLADELADAWDEEDDEMDDGGEHDGVAERDEDLHPSRDSGVDVSSPLLTNSLVRSRALGLARNNRRRSSDYDGSEYGDSPTLEADSTPAGLLAKMDLVESLVRRGTENTGSDEDGAIDRVIDKLRNLGSQSKIEGGTTRLITAHSALSTHLMHQTRVLQSLAYSIFSPLAIPLHQELIDDLIPILIETYELIPRPATEAFKELTKLHTSTSELIQNFNHLSDTLHMSRQTMNTASRRLRSSRELVADMRREEEARIEGESWLKRHDSSHRLENRECARLCGDVLDGFDQVCNGWRARLLAQTGGIEA